MNTTRLSALAAAAMTISSIWAQPGGLDASFDPGAGPNARVLVTTLQADGKVLIAGDFTEVDGQVRNKIARLNADGSLDATFDAGTGPGVFGVFSIAVQTDGRILVGGQFTDFNGVEVNMIVRLEANGNVDGSFDTGSGADWVVFSIAQQPDGKILLGGNFSSFDGRSRSGIVRLLADGGIDQSFDPGTGLATTGSSKRIDAFVLEPDGRINIAGQFNTYNGISRNCIARLNADGSLDPTFDPGTGISFSKVNRMVRQPDGRLIIAGSFTSYNGSTQRRLARVNTDGSLDASLVVGEGPGSAPLGLALQPDGRILIGGLFSDYNEVLAPTVVRLHPDGGLDESWNTGTGSLGSFSGAYDMVLQPDGAVVIGGEFTAFNGTERNHIARLSGGVGTGVVPVGEVSAPVSVWPDPVVETLFLSEPAAGVVMDAHGRIVRTFKRTASLDVAGLPSGCYVLRTMEGRMARFVRE